MLKRLVFGTAMVAAAIAAPASAVHADPTEYGNGACPAFTRLVEVNFDTVDYEIDSITGAGANKVLTADASVVEFEPGFPLAKLDIQFKNHWGWVTLYELTAQTTTPYQEDRRWSSNGDVDYVPGGPQNSYNFLSSLDNRHVELEFCIRPYWG